MRITPMLHSLELTTVEIAHLQLFLGENMPSSPDSPQASIVGKTVYKLAKKLDTYVGTAGFNGNT